MQRQLELLERKISLGLKDLFKRQKEKIQS
jgi:hypothetical protein